MKSIKGVNMKYQIISERSVSYDRKIICPGDLEPILSRYAKKKKEHFYVVTLDGSHKVIRVNLVSIGILNRTLVHPREVFKPAILDDSASIVLVHNHPSGELDPSPEDKKVTERLVEAGDLLGIKVIDHLIISKQGYYSFAENGESSITQSTYLSQSNFQLS